MSHIKQAHLREALYQLLARIPIDQYPTATYSAFGITCTDIDQAMEVVETLLEENIPL